MTIIRQRLQPDGLAYISYNRMPGWAPLAPIRQFMVEVKRRNPGRSERQLALALDLIIDGKDELAAVARQAMGILNVLGRRPMRDGVLIKDDGEARIFLAEQMRPILDHDIPLWRRLGVL